MSKVLKIAAVLVAIAATVATGGALAPLTGVLITGISAATLTAVAIGLTIGASLLSGGKAPPVNNNQISRLQANIDPRTPRKMVFGTTAMATDIRDQEYTDDQTYLHRFLVVASHKVNAIREIWFDDKLAWTLAGGVQGEFVGYLTVAPILEGSSANAINISARMGTTRRYTGLAYVHLRYKLTGNSSSAESPFAQSIPSRMTIIGDGMFVYDPRLDSTVPGGSGSCRADDQSTWIWDDDACRNPALILLAYLLGWRINDRLAVGKGIPPRRFNMPSFITAANVCDESVALAAGGTEPRYRADGVVSEADAPTQVLDALKVTMNAELDDVDGTIRVQCLVNDLASPVWSFTDDDVLGEFTWQPSTPLEESFNIVRGSHPDPSTTSLYQLVDYPQLEATSPDGIDRIDSFDLGFVESAAQCQRLATMRLARNAEGGVFRTTMQATGWKVQKGDPVRGTFGPCGFSNKAFRVAEMELRDDGTVPMMLRVETAEMYGGDGADAEPIAAVAGSAFDPLLSPIVVGIAAASTTAAGAAQTIEITGQNETTAAISFALDVGSAKAITAKIRVASLASAGDQDIEIQWRVAAGSWATLGSVASATGGTGDTITATALETLTNGGGASTLYEVRAVTSSAVSGTVVPSQSFLRA